MRYGTAISPRVCKTRFAAPTPLTGVPLSGSSAVGDCSHNPWHNRSPRMTDSVPSAVRSLRRHHLAWLRRECHAPIIAQLDDLWVRRMVTNFLAAGVPLVSRRQPESEGESSMRWRFVAVGMPLPPSQ